VVAPARWRELVAWSRAAYRLSERRACRALEVARSSVQYIGRRPPQTALRRRMREITEVRLHYGYRRVHVLLRREGWTVNHKKVYRLYREEGLGLRRRKPKRRRAAMSRQARPTASRPNERWTMDFMSDALASGQKLRVLTVVDAFTRECLALEVGTQFRGQDVARVLTRLGVTRGLPTVIQCDNGTEFTSRALDHWAWTRKVALDFSRPGKPTDNATIESFNASVRRECLSEHYFSTLAEAEIVLGIFRDEYNNHRPHSSLGQKTPAEIYAGTRTNADSGEAPKRVA
jgi:putative transposase